MMEILKIQHLQIEIDTKHGVTQPVSAVNFTIEKGEIFALVGESGSGKTLTALSINRLLPINAYLCEGTEIWLGDTPLHQLSEKDMQAVRGTRVAMIFQDPALALNPVMTVEAQIREGFMKNHAKKYSKPMIREKTIELLRRVKIDDPALCLEKYPHELSGGMKQRVMIAIALSGEPELLIADEPTTALDVTTQAEVLNLLKEINQKTQMAILFITHDLGVVASIADSVAVMKEGNIIEQHAKKDFFTQATHPYTLKLIAAMPERLPAKNNQFEPEKDEVPILKVSDLKVYFPIRRGLFKRTVGHVKAVDGISFELYEGETLAIVGGSGSGKTSLGKAIVRLFPSQSGKIYFMQTDFLALSSRKLRDYRASIQMIFQDPYSSVDPRMTVSQIIEEGMIALKIGTDEAERKDRIRVLLEEVELSPALGERYPHELSGGQRQRVSIARALAVGAKLIVCDEPTSSLDVSVQAQILALLKRLQEDLVISYLFITHNMGVVNYMADRVAVMHQGKCVEYGDAQQVLKHPKDPYTQKLLACSVGV